MKPKPLTINGQTRSITGWAKHAHRPLATILLRLKRGWTPEDAVFGEAFAVLEIGDRAMTVHAWSKEPNAVPYGTIYARLKRGWPAERAVFEPSVKSDACLPPRAPAPRSRIGGMRGPVAPSSLPAPILPRWGGVKSVSLDALRRLL